MKSKRIFTPDLSKKDSSVLKGAAILLMLFHHQFLSPDRYKGFYVDFYPFQEAFINHISLASKICVSIFVFISGFGLARSYLISGKDRPEKWMEKRMLRLLSGYWFIYVLAFVICQLINGRTASIYFTDGTVKGISYIAADFLGISELLGTPTLNGTWWYMSIAVLIVLAIPLLQLIDERTGPLGLLLISFFARLVLTPDASGAKDFLMWLPALSIGFAAGKYDFFVKLSEWLQSSFKKRAAFIFALLVFCGIFFCKFHVVPGHAFYWMRYGVFPFLVVILLKYTICRIPYLNSLLARLGSISMEIFLTHTFIRQYYLRSFVYSFEKLLLILAVLFVLSTALAIAVKLLRTAFQKLTLSFKKQIAANK